MAHPKDASALPPVEDLLAPGPGEVELPHLDDEAAERSRDGAFDFDDEATRRLDPDMLEAPLEAPAPARDAPPVSVRLPAAALVVDEDRKRGARTAARLMEHGYTCRVVAPSEVKAAATAQSFDAVLVELGRVQLGEELLRGLRALRTVAPVVVSSSAPFDARGIAEVLLLKPWLTEQAVRAIEEARRRAGDALEPPTLASSPPPTPASLPSPDPRTTPLGSSASPVAADPEAWERFEGKVVRARLADPVGEGFTPGRIRRASYTGVLDIECRRTWARGGQITCELALVDGRRADFSGRVRRASEGSLEVELEVEAADVPFVHAWIEESLDPEARGADPARLVLDHPSSAGDEPASEIPSTADIDALWVSASDDLDDDAAQQRFIQACLATGQLEHAVRRYRGLKEAHPEDPRPQRYLQQVGTILGFYALKQNQPEVEGGGISTRLKLTLGLFLVAALVLLVIAKIAA